MPYVTALLNDYRKKHKYDKYFCGKGIDIGCRRDILSKDVFTKITNIDPYDNFKNPLNDANSCSNIPDNTYDFVYSCHCLEHMVDPYIAFKNWLRICKPNGYMIHAIPHELFYEKNIWPSRFNHDHKTSWTFEWKSELPNSIHTPEFLDHFSSVIDIISIKTILENFDCSRFMEDQTSVHKLGANGTPATQNLKTMDIRQLIKYTAICQIEFIVRKI